MPSFRFSHCHFDLCPLLLLLIVSTFFVFSLFLVVSPQQCVRNCSTVFRHSMSAILGFSTRPPVSPVPLLLMALSPLDMLIRNSPNNVVVQRKTEWICNSIDKFKKCTENCEENRLKLVEMANVDHWAVVCLTLFAHPKIFSEFISCQRKRLAAVGQRCNAPNATTDSGERPKMLGHFCRQMNAYTKCYQRTAQKCTKNATVISRQLSAAIRQSFMRIQQISRGHLRIPAQCHHSVDILAVPTNENKNAGPFSTEGEEKGEDYWMENGEREGKLTESQKEAIGNSGERHHFGKGSIGGFIIIFCIAYLINKVEF